LSAVHVCQPSLTEPYYYLLRQKAAQYGNAANGMIKELKYKIKLIEKKKKNTKTVKSTHVKI